MEIHAQHHLNFVFPSGLSPYPIEVGIWLILFPVKTTQEKTVSNMHREKGG